ncbi:MAG: hypothetical protein RID07_20640 [Lacipirellulaceae bacterium]
MASKLVEQVSAVNIIARESEDDLQEDEATLLMLIYAWINYGLLALVGLLAFLSCLSLGSDPDLLEFLMFGFCGLACLGFSIFKLIKSTKRYLER